LELPKILLNVVDQFSKIPGVGDKTALRQALILSKWTDEEIRNFSSAVNLMTALKKCQHCGMFSDEEICNICSSELRGEQKSLCIVENITDCMAIEKSNQFKGRYHVLGGVLNPLMGIGPDELNIDKLVERIKNEDVLELILAINPSVEGDATCSYINQVIPENVNVERIGFGVPMGGSLEYLDSMTITKALENRKKM
jgi:recombination protein RecR